MPTETVYGLAVDASNASAVAAIYAAKGRPAFNPLIAHVTDLAAAQRFARLDARALKLAQAFWPGPLTIVAPIADPAAVCNLARAGLDTVAVRVPAHPMARAVLAAFGGAVAAPSANRSGRPSPTTYLDALTETGESVALALDGGPCIVGLESTVIALIDGPPRLLRPGGVSPPGGDDGRTHGVHGRGLGLGASLRLAGVLDDLVHAHLPNLAIVAGRSGGQRRHAGGGRLLAGRNRFGFRFGLSFFWLDFWIWLCLFFLISH